MLKSKLLTTPEEVKVFVDPFRFKIFKYYSNKGEPATVKEIADEMGEVPAKVSYHVKKMEKAGILQLVHTKEINGIVAKYYEPTAEDFDIQYDHEAGIEEKAMLAQAEKFVSDVYDDAKNIVLEEIKGPTKSKCQMFSQELYFTEEEMQELKKNIDHIFEKHKHKSKGSDNEKKHYCFVTITEMNNQLKK